MKSFFGIVLYLLFSFSTLYAQEIELSTPQEYQGDWFNLNPEDDQIQGVSVYQAYKFFTDLKIEPVIVAVIDDGVDINHPDLQGKLWMNAGEIPDNGIDDDGNGYIDDVYGWNFLGNPNGENIEGANMELVRLYRPLKEKYENVDSKSIPKADKREYRQYLEYKKAYDAEMSELNDQFAQFAQLAALYQGASQYMMGLLDTDELTLTALLNFESADESELQVRDFLLMAQQEGLQEYLEESNSYFETSIGKHYNLDFNPRSIVNEAQAARDHTGYGNNMVWAGEPNHGTHVAGIIGAVRNNGEGINGVAKNALIMSLRAVPDGDERDEDIALAIRYAADNGARVINMSFGKGYSPSKNLVDDAILYAAQKDVLMIHAAGNDATNNDKIKNYPDGTLGKRKSMDNWITVGASEPILDSTFIAEFSNYGKKSVDILAPGVDILSLVSDGEIDQFSGTSMAAPVVAGIATVIRGAYPALSAKEVKDIILLSAQVDKKLKISFIGEEMKIKKLIRTPGVPSLMMCLVIAEMQTKK